MRKFLACILAIVAIFSLTACKDKIPEGYKPFLEDGMMFDEEAHIPNEKQSLKNYELCYDIYYSAIKKLTK